MFKTTAQKRFTQGAIAALFITTQALAPLSLFVPKVGAMHEAKVIICHRTNSVTNPYTQETVAVSSVDGNSADDNGQGDHLLDHTGPVFDVNTTYPTPHNGDQWGDIIPPFNTDGHSYDNPQTSLNWDSTGQAIWNNGCNLPSGTIKVHKKVDADGNGVYEGGDTTANTIGFRWGYDGETPSRTMGSSASGVYAGTHTVNELPVTGYTFTGWYYTGDHDESCSNPEGTTLPLSITVTNKKTTEITLCNQGVHSGGSITLVKQVINDDGGTAGPNDFGLSIGGTTVTSGQTMSLPAGSYAISEAGLRGYQFVSITGTGCPARLGGLVNLADGQNITCTITNDDIAPELYVTKHVLNDNGGTTMSYDFNLYVNGHLLQNPGKGGGTVEDNSVTYGYDGTLANTPYTISENAVAGYTQTSSVCTDNDTDAIVDQPVVLAPGQRVTCVLTNNDTAPSLTLKKIVSNTHGGAASPTDWTLAANGPTPISGSGGATSGDSFSAGTYTLSESTGPLGYNASDWTCTNGVTVTNNQITLANGQSTTCSITNSDKAPSLTVIKNVFNPYGTPLPATSFPLFVDGQSVTTGVATSAFGAGSHVITETQQPGYTFSGVSGDCSYDKDTDIISIILSLGQSSSCTLTNTAVQPTLTVIKHVINDNGGTRSASDFTMNVDGTHVSDSSFPGAEDPGTTVALDAGHYSVSESGPSGYTATYSDGCSGDLSVGQSATCTITNNDQPASLTIVKQAAPSTDQNFNFTSDELGSFSLKGDGSALSSKTFDDLSAGQYSFSEQSADNWGLQYMYCDNEDYDFSDGTLSVNLDNGTSVTCYVMNVEKNTVTGHKFSDSNNNHKWDSGEITLKNWTITLSKGCDEQEVEALSVVTDGQGSECQGAVNLTTKTDASGAYSFTDLEPGTYTVCEVQQPGWTETFPETKDGCWEITIEGPGQVVAADFGNHKKPEVLGELVNTGANASLSIVVGLAILGSLTGVTYLNGRRQNGVR